MKRREFLKAGRAGLAASAVAAPAFRGDQHLWWQVAEYGFDRFMIRARTRT